MSSYIVGVISTFLAAFSWSLAAVFYGKALSGIKNPILMNVVRIPLAIVVLVFYTIMVGELAYLIASLTNIQFLFYLTVATIIMNVVGDSLYLLAIRNAGVAVGVPLSYMYPVYVALLASLILHEQLTFLIFLGTIIAVSGVWLVSRKEQLRTEKREYNPLIGVLAGVSAAISFSLGIILFKIVVGQTNPIVTAVIKLLILLALISPSIPIKFNEIKNASRKSLMIGMIGGIFGIGVGDLFFYEGLNNITATLATTITTSTHIISLIMAITILKERVNIKQIIGVLLIIIGIILTLT